MDTDRIAIRHSGPDDVAGIVALYPDAFPDEDLLPVVRALLGRADDVLSMVALADHRVIGHVAFTICSVGEAADPAALLAPLAVTPAWQRRGVGSALVRAGLQHMTTHGIATALVLGDPAYYGRFGFVAEAAIAPPYPLPAEWRPAWQSRRLGERDAAISGQLVVPAPWRERSLWTP